MKIMVDKLRSDKAMVALITIVALFFMGASTIKQNVVQASTEEMLYSQEKNMDLSHNAAGWLVAGNNINKEMADDFNLNGIITRVTVRGFSLRDAENLQGFYIRFYDVDGNGAPGNRLTEHFLSIKNPHLSDNPLQPEQISIVLPTPFEATGEHFISVQAITDSPWVWLSANSSKLNGASSYARDVVTRGQDNRWQSEKNYMFNTADNELAFSLYGLVLATDK